MMLPTEAGTYNAIPYSISVVEPENDKPTVVVINYEIYEQVQTDATVAMSDTTIVGWHYIEKKDGSINTHAIKALREALGWDGVDLDWLQDTDLTEHAVTIVLDWESYAGKRKLKLKWLNPYGSTGRGDSAQPSDPAAIQRIQNRLGSKLRALGGGTKRPAPAPTTPDLGCTVKEAWSVFCMACTDKKVSDDNAALEWVRIVELLFPGRASTDLTPAECMKLRDEGPGLIGKPGYTPPSGQDADSDYTPPPADEEIPF